ncbi:unnamed protein product [Gordionus sp. m RMFG-2023]
MESTNDQGITNNPSINSNPLIVAGLILPLVLRPAINKMINNIGMDNSHIDSCIKQLQTAFNKMENVKPGFSYDFIRILLRNAVLSTTNLNKLEESQENEHKIQALETTTLLVDNELQESILRLASSNTVLHSKLEDDSLISSKANIPSSSSIVPTYISDLDMRARELKSVLSKIPDQIRDRKIFLETIKEIAGAIKRLLDAVNEVYLYIGGNEISSFSDTQMEKNNPSMALNEEQKQRFQTLIEQKKREFVRYSKRFSNTLKEYFREGDVYAVFRSANCLVYQADLIAATVKEQILM